MNHESNAVKNGVFMPNLKCSKVVIVFSVSVSNTNRVMGGQVIVAYDLHLAEHFQRS